MVNWPGSVRLRYLTGYYVALSFGGMVGGLFAGLIAPFTFSWIAEYPILIAFAVLCRPSLPERYSGWARWYWIALVIAAVALIAPSYTTGKLFTWIEAQRVYVVSAVAVVGMIMAILLGRSAQARGDHCSCAGADPFLSGG
jgi:hypothetical protein